MPGKRRNEEEIIEILREAEKPDVTVADICRDHGISDATFYKWRNRYGGMDKSEARRLRELEKENAELKKALGEHVIMLNATKEVLKKEAGTKDGPGDCSGSYRAVSTDTIEGFSGAGDDWVHIVGVNDPDTSASYIYINGVLNASAAVVNIPASATAEWTIGRYWNSTGYDFSGALDDVQVYDHALSAEDIAWLNERPGNNLNDRGKGTVITLY